MTNFMRFFSLLAQTEPAANGDEPLQNPFLLITLIVAAAFLIFMLGNWIARQLRMADHGWKIGLVSLTIVAGVFVTMTSWPPKLGIDLSGGVILVYEVNDEEQNVPMSELVAALKRRINPSGVKEIVVRQYGDRQVEIIIPEVEAAEIDYLKQMITTAGALKFRIMAQRSIDDIRLFELAEKNIEIPSRQILDGDQLLGEWAWRGIDKDASTDSDPIYQVNVNPQENMTRTIQGRQQVLMQITTFNVEGKDLESATPDYDEVGRPAVSFTMTGPGAAKFGGLTSTNRNRRLGIVLDEELLSAPSINDTITNRGIITGKFSQQDVDVLAGVLKAGKLPTSLKKDPISDNVVSAILGDDTVQKGKVAITVSLVAVLAFMVLYYRFAGIVACLALAANLLLILSVMILVKAALTLPGLAGLVLTVGMSVDANVLIFERIREELARGSALRMAIRNGFGRATRTIVDANITTLITAVVLYAIGTDQIKGFAVTLFLGILMSMYSAVFCSRVIFDIAERKRWISKLKMTQVIGATNFDFIGKRQIAAVCSLCLIVIGLVGAVTRGKNLFDIDFNGGSSVQIMLNQAMPISDVRDKLTDHLEIYHPSVIGVEIREHPSNTIYKIDTAITGEIDDNTLRDPSSNSVGADTSGLTIIAQEIEKALEGKTKTVDFESRDGHTGQITARITLTDPMALKEVRQKLNPANTSQQVITGIRSFEPIITSAEGTNSEATSTVLVKLKISGSTVLQDQLTKIFPGELRQHQVDFSDPTLVSSGTGTTDAPHEPDLQPPVHSLPAQEEPAQEEPAQEEPAQEEPAQEEPAQEEPAQEEPAQEEPAQEEPAQEEPAQEEPAQEEPAQEEPAQEEPAQEEPAQEEPAQEEPAQEEPAAEQDSNPAANDETSGLDRALPPNSMLAFAGTDGWILAQAETSENNTTTVPADPIPQNTSLGRQPESTTTLTLGVPVPENSLISWIEKSAVQVGLEELKLKDRTTVPEEDRPIRITQQDEEGREWTVQLSATVDQSRRVLSQLKESLDNTPIWLSSNKIGAKVAGDMRNTAVAAIIVSLIGIVIYIWIRFQRIYFGLAAVVALLHDVLITLGALALSFWLAEYLGVLLITEFKISLPIVAAFLTIIGYSLNDTIVVFDRIREVRGKSPGITGEMINKSINQTLSRTFLTSFTTLLVVLILYVIGGESIHGFAFAIVVGILVGTYSSIFVASPALLWMMQSPTQKKSTAVTGRGQIQPDTPIGCSPHS